MKKQVKDLKTGDLFKLGLSQKTWKEVSGLIQFPDEEYIPESRRGSTGLHYDGNNMYILAPTEEVHVHQVKQQII